MGQHYKIITIDPSKKINLYEAKNEKELMKFSYYKSAISNFINSSIYKKPKRIYTIGDYVESQEYTNLNINYNFSSNTTVEISDYLKELPLERLFLVNWDRNEYINLGDYLNLNKAEDIINPLFLLTAIGNGRGSGDYLGPDQELVGKWSGNLISIDSPEYFRGWGLKEIMPRFED